MGKFFILFIQKVIYQHLLGTKLIVQKPSTLPMLQFQHLSLSGLLLGLPEPPLHFLHRCQVLFLKNKSDYVIPLVISHFFKIKSIQGGVCGLSCTCHDLQCLLSYPWPFSALTYSPLSTPYFSSNTLKFLRNLLTDTKGGPLDTPTSKTGQL